MQMFRYSCLREETRRLVHKFEDFMQVNFKKHLVKVTLNSCAHAHSIRHEYNYFCIAGNCNGVRGSVVFWCAKLCKERQ